MSFRNTTIIVAATLLIAAQVLAAPAKKPGWKPEPYSCRRASAPIIVDGILDDAAWKQAKVINMRIPVTYALARSKTEVQILWDDKYLYFAFRAFDKDIWSYMQDHDSVTCFDDVLEMFFMPIPGSGHYHNFEINAIGTVYDAYSLSRYAGGGDHHRWRRWDCQGLKTGITITGTLNNPSDVDSHWCMEVAIPFAEMPDVPNGCPKVGDKWTFHASRYDYSVHLPDGVELSSTAALTKVDFHHAKDWMPLVFTN